MTCCWSRLETIERDLQRNYYINAILVLLSLFLPSSPPSSFKQQQVVDVASLSNEDSYTQSHTHSGSLPTNDDTLDGRQEVTKNVVLTPLLCHLHGLDFMCSGWSHITSVVSLPLSSHFAIQQARPSPTYCYHFHHQASRDPDADIKRNGE